MVYSEHEIFSRFCFLFFSVFDCILQSLNCALIDVNWVADNLYIHCALEQVSSELPASGHERCLFYSIFYCSICNVSNGFRKRLVQEPMSHLKVLKLLISHAKVCARRNFCEFH